MAVVREIKRLNGKFKKIPGVLASLEEAAPDSYVDSPFIDEITKVDLPKKIVIPSMKIYDGTTDPQNHVALYKQKMLAASIPSEFRQVSMCKGFGTTLTRHALKWYINLPTGSIHSFANLINNFNQQFVSSRELEKRSSDLYRITQKPEDTLKFRLARRVLSGSRSNGMTSDLKDLGINKTSTESVDIAGLIQRLENMGSKVGWPTKVENPSPTRDNSKWCEFHMDIGYTTDDCFTLRKKMAYLLKYKYLNDMIRTKGRNADQSKENHKQKQNRNLPPPPPIYEVKFISGGSEICG
ncbi:uncharacterized protein LOC141607784 [Silene latifolia]|uniref:uncharacterized protein LOC141607784 n=1 Tax=Silene latifolia TaxID=37657 RepID=UPI003D771B13